jgi:hypothetical protein
LHPWQVHEGSASYFGQEVRAIKTELNFISDGGIIILVLIIFLEFFLFLPGFHGEHPLKRNSNALLPRYS